MALGLEQHEKEPMIIEPKPDMAGQHCPNLLDMGDSERCSTGASGLRACFWKTAVAAPTVTWLGVGLGLGVRVRVE